MHFAADTFPGKRITRQEMSFVDENGGESSKIGVVGPLLGERIFCTMGTSAF